MLSRVFNNIRKCYKGMDEDRKRCVRSGFFQFPISLAMVIIGLWTLASCEVEKVSLILIIMGFVMCMLALSYIVLGFYTSKCWPIAVIAFIVQFSLQTWAYNNNICPPLTQYCSFNYDVQSSENFCPLWPIRSAIFILTIDVVNSLFGFLKMFCTFPYKECRDDISKCYSKCRECFRNWIVQRNRDFLMTDFNDESRSSLINDTNLDNSDSENEKKNDNNTD